MIILNKPYVSDFLIETIKKNNFAVLDNEIARKYFNLKQLVPTELAAKEEFFYSNSENSIDWILENKPDSKLADMIRISKDKALFREKLKSLFPNYFFKKLSLDELEQQDTKALPYPFVLKPCVGFLSFGVYPIKNEEDWKNTLKNINSDIENFKNIFPQNVVDTTNFIIEEMIEGEEYAIDGYFDAEGNATILNIFLHPFFDEKDVSDRAYYSSKNIIKENLLEFNELLNKIGKACDYKNFPFHLELRKNDKTIIPIELNPLRFCGWCITDIAHFSWGINVYEYFFKQLKPDWNKILENASEDYFYFTLGDIPSTINRKSIKQINYNKYLENIKNPLSIRKIDYKENPLFAIVFAQTKDINEIKNILNLDMQNFIEA